MKWFGESWGAPACVPEELVPTPVGAVCEYCEETIERGDQGFFCTLASGARLQWVSGASYHKNCFLRTVIGSVGHILRRCSCYVKNGGIRVLDDDPVGMTKRQAADAAVKLHRTIQEQGLVQ